MSSVWQNFWRNYRNMEATSESDLYVQVGKTVNKEPISPELLREMIGSIVGRLELCKDDYLVDFCCGNGLVTYEIASFVSGITAVDFADHLINTARRCKFKPEISYQVGDITVPLSRFLPASLMPSKFLMNDALSCFEPLELNELLKNILHHLGGRPFQFLVTGIPNVDLKWKYYDTPERRSRYLENEKRPDNTNDGLGRWWATGEIEILCRQLGIHVQVTNQPSHISNYRMDALISAPYRSTIS